MSVTLSLARHIVSRRRRRCKAIEKVLATPYAALVACKAVHTALLACWGPCQGSPFCRAQPSARALLPSSPVATYALHVTITHSMPRRGPRLKTERRFVLSRTYMPAAACTSPPCSVATDPHPPRATRVRTRRCLSARELSGAHGATDGRHEQGRALVRQRRVSKIDMTGYPAAKGYHHWRAHLSREASAEATHCRIVAMWRCGSGKRRRTPVENTCAPSTVRTTACERVWRRATSTLSGGRLATILQTSSPSCWADYGRQRKREAQAALRRDRVEPELAAG